MAPAADMKWSPDVMKESFYFSNMCPQHPQLNRRGWKNLEEKIRDWAVADSAIIIICGPIIDKPSKTIGKNKVAVPERFFKVILSFCQTGSWHRVLIQQQTGSRAPFHLCSIN